MKTKILLSALAVFALTLTSCKSAGDYRQERLDYCSSICKDNPEIGSLSHEEGGGLFPFGGYKEFNCTCSRSGNAARN